MSNCAEECPPFTGDPLFDSVITTVSTAVMAKFRKEGAENTAAAAGAGH